MSSAVAYRKVGQQNNFLLIAIAVSIAVHALFLAVRFVDPTEFHFKHPDDALDIVLVNKQGQRPVKAKVLAQADSNGGGENDSGRATSFLPASARSNDGELLKDPQSAVARLEAEEKQLLSQLHANEAPAIPLPNEVSPAPTVSDVDDPVARKEQIARQEALISKEIRDYNERPKREVIGPNSRRVSYAMYWRSFAEKIERIGTLNFPEEARGHYYGSLMLSVTLNPDGSIYEDQIRVLSSSGYPVLDRAARRIVLMSAPFSRFSDQMRRENDVYEIVAKFTFTRDEAFEAEVGRR